MNNSIAIVGVGCRFPGGANSLERFWHLLHHQVDAVSQIPPERWQADQFYDSDKDSPGKAVTRWGGFLDEVDQFDPQFFHISPREAIDLDPQQRLLLEVCWEALEQGGMVPEQLKGSRTGVFLGACSTDYFKLRTKFGLRDTFNGYAYTGGRPSVLAGRVAYTFDFRGPTLVVDTACSSSLVALHLACQALNNDEADLAVVGGVNILLDPGVFILASKLGTQSPKGRCKTFDESADGYVRAEGCGILVAKKLTEALQDGSRILAVVKGSSVNQNGNGSSLTAPDASAQASLMRKVLADSGLRPTDISYVEAHGTGTPVGDPIEFGSIWEVFGQHHHAQGNSLPVGSVKTNIGHCEAASGMASLIKVILALKHRQIPASLHFNQLNPAIAPEAASMRVPTAAIPWQATANRRYAAINSFGFSGTNAHVVLAEAVPESGAKPPSAPNQKSAYQMLCLSAISPQALVDQARRYHDYLTTYDDSVDAVCYTANAGRTHFPLRHCVTGRTREHLQEKLSDFMRGEASLKRGTSRRSKLSKIAFLFTGQGSQYVQMGGDLFETNSIFRESIERCDRILTPHLGLSLLSLLYPSDDYQNSQETEQTLQQTAFAQPAIFALEYALYQVWKSWGITPDIVLGHSVGEYVAACVAGLFSLEQGLALIAARGRLMQALPTDGAMAAVSASLSEMNNALGSLPGAISVAAINAPDQTVLSGATDALNPLLQTLEQQQIEVRRLPVSHAFHSALLEPMLEPLRQALSQVEFGTLKIPLVSNLTGELVDIVDSGDIACPDYWLCHTRQGVQFEPSMQTLARVGVQHCVELGPRPTLSSLGRRCLPDSEITWAISLRRGYDDKQILTESLAQLYIHGVEIDFKQGYQGQGLSVVDLPTYPFQRKRYWSKFAVPETVSTNGHQSYSVSSSPGVHPLLGCRGLVGFKGQTYFEAVLSVQTPAFLADHQVDDAVIFPGAGYVEMALAAGQALHRQTPFVVTNLHLRVALPLPAGITRRVQTLLTQREDRFDFEIVSADAANSDNVSEWTHHVTGEIQVVQAPQSSAPALDYVQQQFNQSLNPQHYYQELERTGLHYGPNFRGIQALWVSESQTEALARIQLPAALRPDATHYCLHPVLLDGCSQIARWADGSKTHTLAKVPYFFERIAVNGHLGDQIWCYACKSQTANASDLNPAVDLYLYNSQGEPVAEIRGLHRYSFDRLATAKTQDGAPKSPGQMAYQTRWQRQPLPTPEVSPQLDGLTLLLLPKGAHTAVETMVAAVTDVAEAGVRIILSDQFEALPDQSYRVNMREVDSFEKLLAHLKLAGLPAIRRILHLGSVQSSGATVTSDIQMLQSCGSTLHLVQALEKQSQPIPCDLWLVTTGSQVISPHVRTVDVTGAPLWGLGRVIRSERPELHCRQIDLDPWDRRGARDQLLREIAHSDGEEEVAYRAGQRWVPRLVSLDSLPEEPDCLPVPAAASLRLDIETRGLLDSLVLRAATRQPPGPAEVEVEVIAAALNFRDVLNALGTYKGKPGPLGGEFAGRVVRVGEGVDPGWLGKRVLGLATGSFSRYVIAQHQVIAELPDCLSFEQGAAIPITFLTAYHTLYLLAALKPGERVLIHAGAGGVGLAAIQLAQRAGAEVFATAGSDEKRALLRSLGVQHVMNSRTTEFAAQIQEITQGEGIDVILNSFTGEFIVKGLSLLRPGGRFIELGKAEIWTDTQVAEVNPEATYLPYYLGDYRDNDPTVVQSLFKDVLSLFVQGDLQVLAYRAIPVQRAVEFFRLMQRGSHIGKLVLTFRQLRPKGSIDPEGTYLLTGGLGGIGRVLAQRLVQRGARHLVLLSRGGCAQLLGDSEKAQTARDLIQQLEAQGAQVSILQADVSAYDELSTALTEIRQTLPPLRGIFHAAGALEDGMLSGQTWERFQKGLAAKVQGTWNLHRLSADDELDCFVLFSSVTAVLGPAARGPYAAANLFLDALAHRRSQIGLPCLSVDWGAWANTGMAQEIRTQRKRWQKVQMLTPETGLDWLERLMAQSVHQIGIFPVDWQAFPKRFSGEQAPRYYETLTQPLTAERSVAVASPQADAQPAQARMQSPTVSQPSVQPQTLKLSQMPSSTSANPREESLQYRLAQGISTLLGLESAAELDPHQPLEVYGLDSLMTLELRNWLLKEFQVELPVVQLAKSRSIAELGKQLLQILPTTAFTAEPHRPSQPVSPPLLQPPVQPQPLDTLNQPEENLQSHLAEGISTLLGLESAAELDPHQPLEIYGLDSLMTLELRNWLLKEFQVELPVVQLAKSLSIFDLCERLLQMMPAVKPAAPPVRPTPTPPRLTQTSPAIAPTTSHANARSNGHSNGHTASAESNGSTPGRDRYSFILNLRDLLYHRDDQDLTTFERLTKRTVRSLSGIAAMERIIQDYCAGRASGETLQQSSMRRLKLKLDFNHAGLENIPKIGPAVVVANHPFGYIDGAITEYLVSLRRPDFKILSAPFGSADRFPARAQYILPLTMQGLLREELTEEDIKTLNAAIDYVKRGGALIMFPSGRVSLSQAPFGGSAVDRDWKPFVGQVIVKSQAAVVPIYFEGQNSRLFQVLTRLGGINAMGTLISREQVRRVGSVVKFQIGAQMPYETLQHLTDYKILTRYLRFVTYDLKGKGV